uniref:C2H2-type domain-containing protein n=1 Tax=Caenorhabditis japonica TaxID=281687 RepID=A0A8R1I261_CAEJA
MLSSNFSGFSIKRKADIDLRRPDLKGHFVCGSCRETFQHASSLNRHRLTAHSVEVVCQLCNNQLEASENVRTHMKLHHNYQTVFTCSCCNWTFVEKQQLLVHCTAMQELDRPSEDDAPIAKNLRPPGSLMQEVVQGFKTLSGQISTSYSDSPAPFSKTGLLKRKRNDSVATCSPSPSPCSSRASEFAREYASSPTPPPSETDTDHERFFTILGIFLGCGKFGDITQPENWLRIVMYALVDAEGEGAEMQLLDEDFMKHCVEQTDGEA